VLDIDVHGEVIFVRLAPLITGRVWSEREREREGVILQVAGVSDDFGHIDIW